MGDQAYARNRVALVGYAQSDITRTLDISLGALAVETARDAIDDAGLQPGDVDGFTTGSLFPSVGAHAVEDGRSIVTANWLAQHLGINPRYAAGFQGLGQLPGSVVVAVNAIVSGAADYVLLHRALYNPTGSYHANTDVATSGSAQWTVPQGYFSPLSMIALPHNEYLQRYGVDRASMASVAVEARKNGSRIPWSAWYQRPLSREEYLADPPIVEPVGRLDCDLPVSGVAAFILTSAERAKDLPHRPVYVSGWGMGSPTTKRLDAHWPLDDMMSIGEETVRRLWSMSGLSPHEIDLPQLYDGFSLFVWLWLEALGICRPGEAHQFVADGGIDSDDPSGRPALLSGGSLGNGRMHGVPQMLECYLQLSGRAGQRQRPDVTTGIACHSSPHYGGVVAYANTIF